jgi:hypothetical protein
VVAVQLASQLAFGEPAVGKQALLSFPWVVSDPLNVQHAVLA